MELIDVKNVSGVIECYESKDNGKTWDFCFEKQNLITSVGEQNSAQRLIGDADGYEMGFFAIGSGSSTASKGDTIVDGEYDRFAIDSQSVSVITNGYEIVNTLNLNPAEGNGTIRKIALIGHGPTTTLANYVASDPDAVGFEWKLLNYADILLPSGKVKTVDISLKFIWRVRFTS